MFSSLRRKKDDRIPKVFQRNGADIHTSAFMQAFLHQEGITPPVWPAKSPNLSVIKNIWDLIEIKIQRYTLTNISEITPIVQRLWSEICTESYCRTPLDSIPKRIAAVMKTKMLASDINLTDPPTGFDRFMRLYILFVPHSWSLICPVFLLRDSLFYYIFNCYSDILLVTYVLCAWYFSKCANFLREFFLTKCAINQTIHWWFAYSNKLVSRVSGANSK